MAKTRWARDYTRDIIDVKERFDDAKEHIGEPPDGQIPLNDWGIYTSPNLQSNEPVSPFDCEQYPDSPYCGGNPWTKTPVGLEPEWGFDECGAWVQLSPVLGFTKLPPVSVGWRRPGKCREEEKPDPPDPRPEDDSRPVTPLKFPETIDPNIDVFIVLLRKYRYFLGWQQNDKDQYGTLPPMGVGKEITTHSLVDAVFPSSDSNYVDSYFPSRGTGLQYPVLAWGGATMRQIQIEALTGSIVDYSQTPWVYVGTSTTTSEVTEASGWITKDHAYPQVPNWKRYIHRELKGQYFIINFSQPNFTYPLASVAIYGKISEVKKDWENYVVDASFLFKKGVDGAVNDGGWIIKEEWEIAYISIPDKNKFPPPPDQRRKKDCCMQCCKGGNQQANKQNQDLSEILRLLKKIDKNLGVYPYNIQLFDADENKVGIQKKTVSVKTVAEGGKLAVSEVQRTLKSIGIEHFPIYSPSSMIDDESNGLLGDLGDLKNKIFKQKIESLAEFLIWRAKNDNEIFGQWQEVIEIQDSNPSQKGNQPKRVVLPNMAKTFKEIILLLSVLIKTQGFTMDALLKLYIDVANTKVSASVSEAILRDVQDFLDYPTNTKVLDVPMGITIPKDNDPTDDKEDVERFLRSSTIKAMFDDWTGEGSLHDLLLTLLDAASQIIQKPHT